MNTNSSQKPLTERVKEIIEQKKLAGELQKSIYGDFKVDLRLAELEPEISRFIVFINNLIIDKKIRLGECLTCSDSFGEILEYIKVSFGKDFSERIPVDCGKTYAMLYGMVDMFRKLFTRIVTELLN